jgi:uncharacterized protein (DUF1800 family)
MATSTSALVAHVFRRTTFGPFPGQVDTWAKKGVAATISHVLNAPALSVSDWAHYAALDDGDDAPVRWWLKHMANSNAGLHEKMTFFWHGHFTTGHDKVYRWKCEVPQNVLIRSYAMGNMRTMIQKMTVGSAMLMYLDGSWSVASDPNENYARELMELFLLGRGTVASPNYTQADVENGAKALAGYGVDWDTGKVTFYSDNALPTGQTVPFLGRNVRTAAQVVDAALAKPQAARWIVAAMWKYLIGTNIPAARQTTLAKLLLTNKWNVKPVLSAILHDPAFLYFRMNRPRQPIEWVTAGMSALGLTDAAHPGLRLDTLWTLGQVPFYPPNVAGWPWGNRWVGPGIVLAKAAFAVEAPGLTVVAGAKDQVTAALHRCSIYEVTTPTLTAMRNAVKAPELAGTSSSAKARRAQVLLALAIGSPEFALA